MPFLDGLTKHTTAPHGPGFSPTSQGMTSAQWNAQYCDTIGNILTCGIVFNRIAAQFPGVTNGGITNCRKQRGTGSNSSDWSVHSCAGAVDVWPNGNSSGAIIAYAKQQPEVWDAWLDASPGDVHVQIVPNPPYPNWTPPCAGGSTGGGTTTTTWPRILSAKQIAQLAWNAMGKDTPIRDVQIATAIALCESGGQTCPANTHGDTLHGLWQSDGCSGSTSGADLCNPFTAAASMAGAYHAAKWGCWGCGPEHKGGYLIHMGAAQKATQGMVYGTAVPGLGLPGGQGPCDPRCLQGSGAFFTKHPEKCGGCLPSNAGPESLTAGCPPCNTFGFKIPLGPCLCFDKVFAGLGIGLAALLMLAGVYLLIKTTPQGTSVRQVGRTILAPFSGLKGAARRGRARRTSTQTAKARLATERAAAINEQEIARVAQGQDSNPKQGKDVGATRRKGLGDSSRGRGE